MPPSATGRCFRWPARARAVRIDDCLIVDGHPDNAFVHVLLRIGHGRSDAQKSALGNACSGR